MRTVIKLLGGLDATRRVAIVHSNGFYTAEQQYYFRNVYNGQTIAEGWASIPGSVSIYSDVETAEREARVEHRWLGEGQWASHTGT